jgi:hypothetical protein
LGEIWEKIGNLIAYLVFYWNKKFGPNKLCSSRTRLERFLIDCGPESRPILNKNVLQQYRSKIEDSYH